MATPEVLVLSPGYDDPDDTSIFENKSGLAEDMRFLASMPELCDVTFLVGDTREPVCAVKAVLCARSRQVNKAQNSRKMVFSNCRVFQNMMCAKKEEPKKKEPAKHESKLKAFIKRSSEPLLIMQNTQHHSHQIPKVYTIFQKQRKMFIHFLHSFSNQHLPINTKP